MSVLITACGAAAALLLLPVAMYAQPSAGVGAAAKFSVASIRPCDLREGGAGRGGSRAGASSGAPSSSAPNSGRLVLNCVDAARLINTAYVQFGARNDRDTSITIIGGPDWIKAGNGPNFSSSNRYTIQAEADGHPGQEIMRGPMLRSLLEERFQLRVHRETKEVPGYALTVDKGEARLQPFDGKCFNIDFGKVPRQELEPGQAPCEHGDGRKGPNIAVALQADSLKSFSNLLAHLTGRPVLDKTGITGLFDFEFEYGADENSPPAYQPVEFCEGRANLRVCKTNTGTAADPAGPSIFTVLREQFGLKLEPAAAPKEFLVIDRVERPSGN